MEPFMVEDVEAWRTTRDICLVKVERSPLRPAGLEATLFTPGPCCPPYSIGEVCLANKRWKKLGCLPFSTPERALKSPPSPLSNLLSLFVKPRGEIKAPRPQGSPALHFKCLLFYSSPPFRASCESWSPKMVSALSVPPTLLAFKGDMVLRSTAGV